MGVHGENPKAEKQGSLDNNGPIREAIPNSTNPIRPRNSMMTSAPPKQPVIVHPPHSHSTWNPHVLVSRRLHDACMLHSSRLAENTTIESSTGSSSNATLAAGSGKGNIGHFQHLAQTASPRSSCPQPPLDDGVTGGGSSISCDVHFSGMNVRLDPLERSAPHRIVVPGRVEDAVGESLLGRQGSSVRGELDGNSDGEQRSATWNAITALATLCDEVHELDKTFKSQIIPSIVLFSADDSSISPNQLSGTSSKKDLVDEEVQNRRESELLARIGKFLPALQLASNGTARLRRLIRNMVVQLGGCATPAAVPFYFDGHHNKEGEENDDEGDDESSAGQKISSPSTLAEAKKVKEQSTRGSASEEGLSGSRRVSQGSPSSGEQPPVFGMGVPLFQLGKAIGTAFRILVTVDSAVASNGDLQEAWAMYKDVVMEWSEQKRVENKLDSEFESFERMMVQLDFHLISSRSFVAAIEQNFDPRGRFQAVRFQLHEEVRSILMTLYGQFCSRINTEEETSERLDCVGVYAMYVLYRHLLPPNIVPDAKLHKSLWSVFPAMCPVLELFGPLHFIPREFIMVHAPYEAVKGCSAQISEIRSGSAALVVKWDGSFAARVNKIRIDALGWIALADSELAPIVPESNARTGEEDWDGSGEGGKFNLASSVASIERATSCILRGLKIAHSASILLRSQLLAHRAFGIDHDPSHISSLMSLMEVLKSIEKLLCVRRRSAVIAFQRSTLKMVASSILKRFDKVRSYVDQYSASIDPSRLNDKARSIARVGACLSALEGVLKGTSSFSPVRRYSISFSIAACMDSIILDVFTPDDLLAVEGHLKDLNDVASIEEELHHVCDCSFLYFYRYLFPTFIRALYKISAESAFSRTQLVLSAMSDPGRILKYAQHLEREKLSGLTSCYSGYQEFASGVIQDEYIEPVCEMIEIDLRLAAHAKNSESSKHPSTNSSVEKRLRNFISAPPLYICRRKIDVKAEVEKYLERTFYNLCTVNLNDCGTYNEMRIMANERFGLNLIDSCLPDGSLDQGVDFIDILRELNSFVSRYNYNMIEQSFVERRPERGAKSLCTINVKCVSASFKQHGLGVVTLAVNISYKLLAQKFQLFTQFLADDHIKSLLAKEARWFNNQKNEGNTAYPFNRASLFAQEVKKLGQTESGNTGLDNCRILITEMGNVISLVRLIRASKRKVLSESMQFLPSLGTYIKNRNEPYLGKSSAQDGERSSARVGLEECISAIIHKPDPDFVRAYVNVFKGVIAKSENSFMSGFFCMVPALCLCWMDASLQGKEMMHKKNITRDGYYTDDGFAVGLAFILSVLGQVKQYESLYWFKSIQNKYAADEEDLMEKMNAEEVKRNAKLAASKQSSWFSSVADSNIEDADDDELTILKMMRKRLEGNKREMAMLFFSIHGAQTFFKNIQSN